VLIYIDRLLLNGYMDIQIYPDIHKQS